MHLSTRKCYFYWEKRLKKFNQYGYRSRKFLAEIYQRHFPLLEELVDPLTFTYVLPLPFYVEHFLEKNIKNNFYYFFNYSYAKLTQLSDKNKLDEFQAKMQTQRWYFLQLSPFKIRHNTNQSLPSAPLRKELFIFVNSQLNNKADSGAPVLQAVRSQLAQIPWTEFTLFNKTFINLQQLQLSLAIKSHELSILKIKQPAAKVIALQENKQQQLRVTRKLQYENIAYNYLLSAHTAQHTIASKLLNSLKIISKTLLKSQLQYEMDDTINNEEKILAMRRLLVRHIHTEAQHDSLVLSKKNLHQQHFAEQKNIFHENLKLIFKANNLQHLSKETIKAESTTHDIIVPAIKKDPLTISNEKDFSPQQIEQMAQKVYRIFEKKILIKAEKKGLR